MEKRITTKDLISKKGAEKIAMITAYDAMFARFADEAGIDIILVGDSLGNVVLGFDSTIPVTTDMMLHHTSAVSRGAKRAFILGDMPFARAQFSADSLLRDAARFLQEGGAHGVKIEGGAEIAQKVKILTDAGIPVMAHIGLQPQQYIRLGGYRKFGKTPAEFQKILDDAKALEDAGAFAVLMEMTDPECAKAVTNAVRVPTIGIGAGSACDGQVLVCSDLLGMSSFTPKFAKRYAEIGRQIVDAYKEFALDVKSGKFPSE